jgi:hypothetical protein
MIFSVVRSETFPFLQGAKSPGTTHFCFEGKSCATKSRVRRRTGRMTLRIVACDNKTSVLPGSVRSEVIPALRILGRFKISKDPWGQQCIVLQACQSASEASACISQPPSLPSGMDDCINFNRIRGFGYTVWCTRRQTRRDSAPSSTPDTSVGSFTASIWPTKSSLQRVKTNEESEDVIHYDVWLIGPAAGLPSFARAEVAKTTLREQ